MPLFRCEKCGCVENTAVCYYWVRKEDTLALCSQCDPKINKWHGIFPRRSAVGYLLGNDGFLYTKEQEESGQLDWRKEHQEFKIVCVVGKVE